MYASAMSIITGFESEFPSEQTDEARKSEIDYGQVFKALEHDLGAAENVFAWNAKQDFRNRIEGHIMRRTLEEAGDLLPSWVVQSSVTMLKTPTSAETYIAWRILALSDLVKALAYEVNALMGDASKVIMIGSLSTTIRYSGSDSCRVTFALRQQWARGWR